MEADDMRPAENHEMRLVARTESGKLFKLYVNLTGECDREGGTNRVCMVAITAPGGEGGNQELWVKPGDVEETNGDRLNPSEYVWLDEVD